MAANLTPMEARLHNAAQRARENSKLSPAELQEAFTRFRAQVQERRGLACCIDALHSFLSGMLGTVACGKVIRAAARHSEITEAGWDDFIVRLACMSSDLCGEGAGVIISYIGNLAGPESA